MKRKMFTQSIKNKYLKILLITNILLYALALFFAPPVMSIVGVISAIVFVWCIKKPVSGVKDDEENEEIYKG